MSRYDGTRPMTPAPPGASGMRRLREVPTVAGVLEHTLARGERLDQLAQHYYGDSRSWWWILDANPQLLCGADLREATGRVIVIPRAQP